MKIGVVQLKPLPGDLEGNIKNHIGYCQFAGSKGVDLLLFPELSITGYTTTMARKFALKQSDERLQIFKELSARYHMTLAIGAPINLNKQIVIGSILFKSDRTETYSKRFLHEDEQPFYDDGTGWDGVMRNGVALSICYELSVPEHSSHAANQGSKVYAVMAAKHAKGVEDSTIKLQDINRTHGMTSILCNCIGLVDGIQSAGGSRIINKNGVILESLGDDNEGVLIYNTNSGAIEKYSEDYFTTTDFAT